MIKSNTKVKCAARFKVTITRIMQLDNIEFHLDDKDEADAVVVDTKLVEAYVSELWSNGKIDPHQGDEYSEEADDYDGTVEDVLSFEIIEPEKPLPDPDQVVLDLK